MQELLKGSAFAILHTKFCRSVACNQNIQVAFPRHHFACLLFGEGKGRGGDIVNDF